MTVETQILQYLNSLHPALNLSLLQARHILKIVEAPQTTNATVRLCRNFIRTIITDDETINQAILTALNNTQPQGGYLYECYNSNTQLEGKIYSLNPELF